jgi:5-hydroxyisourate hydrolase
MAGARPTISTHVLDTERGVPAHGVAVAVFRLTDDGGSELINEVETDADGRIADLLDGDDLEIGDYQILFDVASYRGEDSFFQGCAVGVRIDDPERNYHVPMLLAPFGLTTYRGS